MKGLFDVIFFLAMINVIAFIYKDIYGTDRELALKLLIPLFISLGAYCIRVGIIKFTREK